MRDHDRARPLLRLAVAGAWFLSGWMHRVYDGRPGALGRVFGPVERLTYRLLGIDPAQEQTWREYARSVLLFSAAGVGAPLRPPAAAGPPAAQPRRLEGRPPRHRVQHRLELRHQHQLAELRRRVDDVVPHADGRPGGAELRLRRRRHRHRRRADPRLHALRLGDDRQLLGRPRSAAASTCCSRSPSCSRSCSSSRGVVQTFAGPVTAHTLEGAEQVIARGPAASQIAIKHLGTNGGGFFNANSAHPFESGTPLTNTLELWAELLIAVRDALPVRPHARPPAPGRRAVRGDGLIFGTGLAVSLSAETRSTPALTAAGLVTRAQHGGQGAAAHRAGGGDVLGRHDDDVDRRRQLRRTTRTRGRRRHRR